MSFWRLLSHAVFTGDRGWAWRRRVTFTGCAVFLYGIIHAIRFEPDKAWAAVVLTQCGLGFLSTLGIYAGLAGYDDHQKRKLGADEKPAG